MRNLIISAFLGLAIGASYALAQPQSNPGIATLTPSITSSAARACLFPAGGWAIVDCSNASAASSAQLNAWSRYVVQCGDDSYLATGTAATGQMADANDGWLPSGAWLELMTTDTLRYVSCLNKTIDSDCRLWECR